jgi:hypothetical protein
VSEIEAGDVIDQGPIPAEVFEVEDAGGDRVHRGPLGKAWACWPEERCIWHTEDEILSYGPLTVVSIGERPNLGRAFYLSDDQLLAVRELLALVHFDSLAEEWLAILPAEFRPREHGGGR